MNTRPTNIMLFAICLTLLIIGPALLSRPSSFYPSMHWGDVLDLLTPLVMIPLYWHLFTSGGRVAPGRTASLAFMILAAVWVEGQGMHLAANSIGNLMGEGAGAVQSLVHFYDEVLSHYIWHAGLLSLSVLLLLQTGRAELSGAKVSWAWVAPAGVLYGLTMFLAIDEGATVPMGLPAVVLLALGLLLFGRPRLWGDNLQAFFLLGYGLTSLLFGAWFAAWGYFPEIMDVMKLIR
jgi:hypothetical protein